MSHTFWYGLMKLIKLLSSILLKTVWMVGGLHRRKSIKLRIFVYTMRFEYLFEHTAGKIKVFGTCFKKMATCCSFQNTQLDPWLWTYTMPWPTIMTVNFFNKFSTTKIILYPAKIIKTFLKSDWLQQLVQHSLWRIRVTVIHITHTRRSKLTK